MTKLSKSFVFYMKNFNTMEALNDLLDEDLTSIDKLLESSGYENSRKMIEDVSEKANETAKDILLKVSDKIKEKYGFEKKSRGSTIRDYWCVEMWMYERKPEKRKGYVLKVNLFPPEDESSKIALLTCSIYDRRENDTESLEYIFKKNLKECYDDVFWDNEWPIFDVYASEDQEEDEIVEEFIDGLSKVLTKENLKKLFTEDKKAKTKPVKKYKRNGK
jgi:hypothetical protein